MPLARMLESKKNMDVVLFRFHGESSLTLLEKSSVSTTKDTFPYISSRRADLKSRAWNFPSVWPLEKDYHALMMKFIFQPNAASKVAWDQIEIANVEKSNPFEDDLNEGILFEAEHAYVGQLSEFESKEKMDQTSSASVVKNTAEKIKMLARIIAGDLLINISSLNFLSGCGTAAFTLDGAVHKPAIVKYVVRADSKVELSFIPPEGSKFDVLPCVLDSRGVSKISIGALIPKMRFLHPRGPENARGPVLEDENGQILPVRRLRPISMLTPISHPIYQLLKILKEVNSDTFNPVARKIVKDYYITDDLFQTSAAAYGAFEN